MSAFMILDIESEVNFDVMAFPEDHTASSGPHFTMLFA